MARARRDRVDAAFERAASGEAHPGLLLDRGFADSSSVKGGEGESGKATLLGRVAGATPGALYRAAYDRWRAALDDRPTVRTMKLAVRGTLIVGLGGASVLETGITLQHTYGMPVIPGAALKGLARRYAEQVARAEGGGNDGAAAASERAGLAAGGDSHEVLFGHLKSAGYVSYFDAWYVPGSAPDDRPFVRDVVTVHHPRYYTRFGNERRLPSDFDDPTPVPFVGARGRFLLAVEGPDAPWADAALALLMAALDELGVGGKTAAGYGRLVDPAVAPVAPRQAQGGPAEGPERTTLALRAASEQGGAGREPRSPAAAPSLVGEDRVARQEAARRDEEKMREARSKSAELAAAIKALPLAELSGKLGEYAGEWRTLAEQDTEAGVLLAWAINERLARAKNDPAAYSKLQQRPWVRDVREYLDKYGRRRR